ncbi:F0F1 ATP synthase subunit delta [Tropicimonas sp. IMCC34011]|uniref:F0F1 ATP synthase subunit delta n=1 Tax=Tropicimonas sp. IMCC34011 TaxID=2248759 RepID=UPI000E261023|nr:F0F1 ATP synthase subunit delta [Tropicimonas sp. IMCC34011]
MSETASISNSIAGRYAAALFDLAKGEGKLDVLERDVDTLAAALDQSADLRELIHSPVYTRQEQRTGVLAVGEKAGLDPLTRNTLGLMADNRRLFALPQFVAAAREMIAEDKGEVTADVTSAIELDDSQRGRLAETLKSRFGKDIKLNTTVDDSLIGGLIVKVGSKMIDTSVRARLAALRNSMKEVG